MNITITITDLDIPRSTDIMVDNGQNIKTTFRVLSENIPDFISLPDVKQVRLKENGRIISTDTTYREAQIFSGYEIIVMN